MHWAAVDARPRERPAEANVVVRWAFLAFVFSLPFAYPDRTIPVEVSTLTGAGFLCATLLQPRVCYGRRPVALGFFVAYLGALLASVIFNWHRYKPWMLRSLLDGPPSAIILFVQILLLFWAAFNLMRDPRVSRAALRTFVAACVLLGALQIAFGSSSVGRNLPRVSILGQNANRTAQTLGCGVLILIGLAYSGRERLLRNRILVWAAAALLTTAVLRGASRGAILALAVGLLALTLSAPTLAVRIRNTAVVIVALAGLTFLAIRSPIVSSRFERAAEGDFAKREQIFPAAWHMFLEEPVIGWGPTANHYELATHVFERDYHSSRDTHNLALEVLTATGLLGAIPFFIGTLFCVWAAWRARVGRFGLLPFALVLSTLVANATHDFVEFKLHWLILAFAVASAAPLGIRRFDAAPHPYTGRL